ncbi:Tn3 family transposase [Streptomyces sp. NPDC046197]|uniref:Tn3 family transposase n=1 Tax=Streptomyces sp. NPDC046197 TaxID=3154337 RepID=UPI0033CA4AEC
MLTNAVIFHNALDIAEIVRRLLEEGWEIDPEELAHISPYLTLHINPFGEYSTYQLGIQPEAEDPKLDVDSTPLREQDWPRPSRARSPEPARTGAATLPARAPGRYGFRRCCPPP